MINSLRLGAAAGLYTQVFTQIETKQVLSVGPLRLYRKTTDINLGRVIRRKEEAHVFPLVS